MQNRCDFKEDPFQRTSLVPPPSPALSRLRPRCHPETSNFRGIIAEKTFWKFARATVNYRGGDRRGNVGSRSRFFIRLRRPQQDPRKKRRQRRESRESVRAATKVSRRLPRPVASWGPRYRYDVDIWRALLLHPRPVCSLCSLHRQPSLPSK